MLVRIKVHFNADILIREGITPGFHTYTHCIINQCMHIYFVTLFSKCRTVFSHAAYNLAGTVSMLRDSLQVIEDIRTKLFRFFISR